MGETRDSDAQRLSSSHPSSEWRLVESTRPPTTPSRSATLTSERISMPTLSCPEAPQCTPVLPTECRRRSPLLPHPPSRSRSLLHQREILRLDRRIHPCFPLHLPADVDLQAGIRRVRPSHCPPPVL